MAVERAGTGVPTVPAAGMDGSQAPTGSVSGTTRSGGSRPDGRGCSEA